ncbi:MAG: putative Aminoglycoside phosphotransferase [Pseudonocardiales bacterium]|nr:putative Aminoglycoside phosphotransferase [Pseudonocardiales bacterium]
MSQDETITSAAVDAKVKDWLERELGPVISMERQERWRPAWFAEVEMDGGTRKIYVRGHRGGKYRDLITLEQEADVLRILYRHDVPIAKVHGMIADPPAIVMDRLAGRVNLATAVDDEEREAVLDQYVEAMRKMHEIDVEEFRAIGLPIPVDQKDASLAFYGRAMDSYREFKSGPSPMIEFVWLWMQRNYPKHRNRKALLQADSAQFLFENSTLSGLIDFEAAYVGDPAAEFAAMRTRDCEEKLGDIARLARKYEAATGDSLDQNTVEYHTAGWSIVTPMQWEDSVRNPAPGDSWLEYFIWYMVVGKWGLEAMAEVIGTTLDDIELPSAAHASPWTGPAYGHLLSILDEWPSGSDFDNFRAETARSVTKFTQRVDQYGRELEQRDIDEISEILGEQQTDLASAEAALEKFVLSADSTADAVLVGYFHRWTQRQLFLVEGTGAKHEHLLHIKPQPIPGL